MIATLSCISHDVKFVKNEINEIKVRPTNIEKLTSFNTKDYQFSIEMRSTGKHMKRNISMLSEIFINFQ